MLYLFDLDGTLIDSEVGIVESIRYAFAQLNVTAPSSEVLRGWIGPLLRVSFPGVLGDDAELTETAIQHYRTRFNREGWTEHQVYAGMPQVLESLQGTGHRFAIVTTKMQTQAQRIVDHLPFGHYFEKVYGPAGDGLHSGKDVMIARALQDFSVPASEAVMIGDRHLDIQGALANGVRAIGVLWGFGSRKELEVAGASEIVASPAELSALLGV